MANYTLRQLAYFVAVAETGSISGAAGGLHVSPTAVASALTELEKVFGTQLVVRRKAHGVSLTPSGSYLHSRAADLLRQADDLELNVASGGAELNGPLVIGCYSTVAPTVVPPLLEWFADNHPKVQVRVLEGSQVELPNRLLAGELELAVVYDLNLPTGLNSVVLYEAPAYVLLPADHRLANRPAVSLRELADEPMILLDVPPAAQHTMALFDRAGVEPNVALRASDFELTRSLVARGMGYAILIQRPVVGQSYEGLPVVVKEIRPAVRPIRVKAVWPETVRLTDRGRALLDFARDAGFGNAQRGRIPGETSVVVRS
ncbi:LysR family transcriptional regulator [Saccharopolyspora sp. WRP15-2]|uniref:LysR family transcriptional regulator n=1 Tax=Saccharopolyspora oryzae TaxID=2997343 RepID=A0ABT4V2Y5_9PSEU|nr:LysR family transcriptional regulator [Saccharopolyspora oryzae]MDA3628324.1 LysR family transcriptional regulator [Saccharopolyspora oryzae]